MHETLLFFCASTCLHHYCGHLKLRCVIEVRGIFREEIRRLCAGFSPKHSTQVASGGVLCIDPNIFCGQVAGQEFVSCVSHV